MSLFDYFFSSDLEVPELNFCPEYLLVNMLVVFASAKTSAVIQGNNMTGPGLIYWLWAPGSLNFGLFLKALTFTDSQQQIKGLH